MNEKIKVFLTTCPKCGEDLEPSWSVCPLCGLRIKPEESLLMRSVIWLSLLVGYVLMVLAIAKTDQNLAVCFGVVVGLPLAYVFGKALIFRMSGQPLTLGQLGRTGLRAGLITFLTVVVAPVVLGIACLLLLFAICASGGAFR